MIQVSGSSIGRLVLIVFALFMFHSAEAACSSDRVKEMSKKGRTVASIAKTCKMDKDDVQAILDEDEEDDVDGGGSGGGGSNGKLPSGAPVGQCGCWGPGYQTAHPKCKSGYARPSACPALCPAGGYAWQGVCR